MISEIMLYNMIEFGDFFIDTCDLPVVSFFQVSKQIRPNLLHKVQLERMTRLLFLCVMSFFARIWQTITNRRIESDSYRSNFCQS